MRKLKLRHEVTDSDVNAKMSMAMINDASEMGFPVRQIEKVVRRRLGELGRRLVSQHQLAPTLSTRSCTFDRV